MAGEANAAFERHLAEARHEVATVEIRSRGQTEMVIREAERAYDIIRQEARGAVSETSSEEHRFAFLLRLQESQLHSQCSELSRMKDWMEQSHAEARARDARLEEHTERKI